MNTHRILAALFAIGAVTACAKNAVQVLPTDVPAGSQIKFFNLGLNAPGVNFYAGAAKIATTSDPLGVRYGTAAAGAAYTAIVPGQYTFTGRIATGANKDTAIATVTSAVADTKFYSFYLSGVYDSIARRAEAFIVEDTYSQTIDQSTAYIRFVNAIYNARPLNLYGANAFTTDTVALGGPVAYKSAGGFTAVPTGIYNLFARYTDSTANKVARATQSFLGGHLYTVSARGDITITSTTATNRPFLDNTPHQ